MSVIYPNRSLDIGILDLDIGIPVELEVAVDVIAVRKVERHLKLKA
jgi:hypothetical protein